MKLKNLFKLLVIVNFLALGTHAKLNLCDVETGQTNIILDIEESRGDCKYKAIIRWLGSQSLMGKAGAWRNAFKFLRFRAEVKAISNA